MLYLIDTIGNETGLNLYDKAFLNAFSKNGRDVVVLSNFEDDGVRPMLLNFYHGNTFKKIFGLIVSWVKLFFFVLKHPKDSFFYQSFGLRFIDMIFLLLFIKRKTLFVIVHDVFEITDGKKGDFKKKMQVYIYTHWIKNVLCHSNLSEKILKEEVHYTGNILRFPHFQYDFDKHFDESSIDSEVKNAVVEGKNNFLFFGQIRESKGIDVLIDAIGLLEGDESLNIIIAGSDKYGLMSSVKLPQNVKLICRYIRDDELSFLFTKAQAVILPYKEIFQSGVLEMVVYFRKFAIMSDVRAFQEFVNLYPSFGVTYSPNIGTSLAACMKNNLVIPPYSQDDICKYQNDRDVSNLIRQIDSLCL